MATIDVKVNKDSQVVKILHKMSAKCRDSQQKTHRKQSFKAIISQLVVPGMYIYYQKFVKTPRKIHI